MEDHPVQLAAVCAAAVVDVFGLIALNRYKRDQSQPCRWCWSQKRLAYWSLMAALTFVALWLDFNYPISAFLMPVKAYCFAFLVGLLDLFFSRTRGVPLQVIAGAALWCSTVLIRQFVLGRTFGSITHPVIVRELSLRVVLVEVLRYVGSLPLIGLLSDLIFSPMHRLAHSPSLYKGHHKVHHEYTNNLTALVLYHGALLDDFLMPFTTAIGGFLYVCVLSLFSLEAEAFSNVSGYLIIFNTLMSHAHDVRCARLMAPLPDSLNFVAYHYVHHLSPSNNFGLTEPSDLLWDKILGVRTICKHDAFVDSSSGEVKAQ